MLESEGDGAKLFKRLSRLSGPQRLMLVEAAALLTAARAAVALLPFKRMIALGARPLGTRRADDAHRQVVWAIEAAARRLPVRLVCMHKGLAAQWMLRRRGVDARLHYGIAYDPADKLEAHVWVARGDDILIGAEEAPRFRCVATFPDTRRSAA